MSAKGFGSEVGMQKGSKESHCKNTDKCTLSLVFSLHICKSKGFVLFCLFQHEKPFKNVMKVEIHRSSQYFMSVLRAHNAPSNSSTSAWRSMDPRLRAFSRCDLKEAFQVLDSRNPQSLGAFMEFLCWCPAWPGYCILAQ